MLDRTKLQSWIKEEMDMKRYQNLACLLQGANISAFAPPRSGAEWICTDDTGTYIYLWAWSVETRKVALRIVREILEGGGEAAP